MHIDPSSLGVAFRHYRIVHVRVRKWQSQNELTRQSVVATISSSAPGPIRPCSGYSSTSFSFSWYPFESELSLAAATGWWESGMRILTTHRSTLVFRLADEIWENEKQWRVRSLVCKMTPGGVCTPHAFGPCDLDWTF